MTALRIALGKIMQTVTPPRTALLSHNTCLPISLSESPCLIARRSQVQFHEWSFYVELIVFPVSLWIFYRFLPQSMSMSMHIRQTRDTTADFDEL